MGKKGPWWKHHKGRKLSASDSASESDSEEDSDSDDKMSKKHHRFASGPHHHKPSFGRFPKSSEDSEGESSELTDSSASGDETSKHMKGKGPWWLNHPKHSKDAEGESSELADSSASGEEKKGPWWLKHKHSKGTEGESGEQGDSSVSGEDDDSKTHGSWWSKHHKKHDEGESGSEADSSVVEDKDMKKGPWWRHHKGRKLSASESASDSDSDEEEESDFESKLSKRHHHRARGSHHRKPHFGRFPKPYPKFWKNRGEKKKKKTPNLILHLLMKTKTMSLTLLTLIHQLIHQSFLLLLQIHLLFQLLKFKLQPLLLFLHSIQTMLQAEENYKSSSLGTNESCMQQFKFVHLTLTQVQQVAC